MNQFGVSMLDSTPKPQKSEISRVGSPSYVELINVMTLLDNKICQVSAMVHCFSEYEQLTTDNVQFYFFRS